MMINREILQYSTNKTLTTDNKAHQEYSSLLYYICNTINKMVKILKKYGTHIMFSSLLKTCNLLPPIKDNQKL